LKTTREFYGSPGDKRFALVNSDTLPWPRKFWPAVPGFKRISAVHKGNRLLGIRIDQFRWEGKSTITLTLLNAGGEDNGAAVGGCTLRYRQTDKGKVVELSPSKE
jgi:hypothetical protein